jgi:Predicted membrane protein (DUF2243)
MVDSIASHWVLGIHRVKLDSPNPLMWDLIWFTAFGVVPLVIGWFMLRGTSPDGRRLSGSTIVLLALTALTAGAGAWSLEPPPNQPFTTVVFAPGAEPQQVLSAITAADARLVWTDPAMGVVVVDVPPERRWSFYWAGALLVSGSGPPAGCFNWSRV